MQPDRVMLLPGERVRTTGRIKAPRHVSGEPRQHSLTVAARSRSAPSYAQATFQQRALFPRGLRTMLAMLLIVGIWGGALGAGYLWWQSRDDEEEQAAAELVDVDGDGVRETPADQLIDTDGDGVGDTLAAVVAEQVAAGEVAGEPQPGGSDVPTRTSMGGTVAAADGGEAPGVDVTLTPIDLGAPPPAGATAARLRQRRAARGRAGHGRRSTGRPGSVATGPTSAAASARRSRCRTPRRPTAVACGSSAACRSARATRSRSRGRGTTTQSFVVTPSADGRPIDLPVEMETGRRRRPRHRHRPGRRARQRQARAERRPARVRLGERVAGRRRDVLVHRRQHAGHVHAAGDGARASAPRSSRSRWRRARTAAASTSG